MKKNLLTIIFILAGAAGAFAEAPNLLTYQGRLKEGGLAVTGNRTVDLRICDAETGGNCYSDGPQSVSVQNGLFRSTFTIPVLATIGSGTWYLEVKVGSSALTPRERLTSSAYAVFAATAALAVTVPDGSVTKAKLAQDSCTNGQILKLAGGAWTCGTDATSVGSIGNSYYLQMVDIPGTGFVNSQLQQNAAGTGITALGNSSFTVTGGAFSVGGPAFAVDSGSVSLTGVIRSSGTGDNYFAGLVGIKKAAPVYELDVSGSINADSTLCIAGSCKASWAAAGDNLGSHTATQDMNMAGKAVIGASSVTAAGALTVYSSATINSGNSQSLLGLQSAAGAGYLSFAKTGVGTLGSMAWVTGSGSVFPSGEEISAGLAINGLNGLQLGDNNNMGLTLLGGKVGVNTASPQYSLDVTTAAATDGFVARIGSDGILISTGGAIQTAGKGHGEVAGSQRGIGAVDLQTARATASQVAFSTFSVIGGGQNNTVNPASDYSVIAGGYNNTVNKTYSTVSGGASNRALNDYSAVAGGIDNQATGHTSFMGAGQGNRASGQRSVVPGGYKSSAVGDYSFAGGKQSSSTFAGAFTWSDSKNAFDTVFTENNVPERAWFKMSGGFLVSGSTNTNMTGAADRGFVITGDGLVGVSTGAPQAALDVVSTGTAANVYAQLWRNSAGAAVATMTATGALSAKSFTPGVQNMDISSSLTSLASDGSGVVMLTQTTAASSISAITGCNSGLVPQGQQVLFVASVYGAGGITLLDTAVGVATADNLVLSASWNFSSGTSAGSTITLLCTTINGTKVWVETGRSLNIN